MNKALISKDEDYAKWYQNIISEADLAEHSPVRGCMIIKPWGYGIWENIQRILDKSIKDTGHENVYFPLLIPLDYLTKEAQHIEGFAKECAVVTHHRFQVTSDGKYKLEGELETPYVIRPTSEVVIGERFSKWIQSYKDLPLKINQWANVMRWEMRPRLFLRTSEFLWQEGHTAHASAEEAVDETVQMLEIYEDFMINSLAIPVVKGVKTNSEKFPGAVETYTLEAMMGDRKALQGCTSHFLGQTFAKAFDILYSDSQGKRHHVWTTSWGLSTRIIGAIIMTHSDENGLVLPPIIAPKQIVIIPIDKNEEEREKIINYCKNISTSLNSCTYQNTNIRSHIDLRTSTRTNRLWQWIKKGVPILMEIGIREIETGNLQLTLRTEGRNIKHTLSIDQLTEKLPTLLQQIHNELLNRNTAFLAANIHEVSNLEEFNRLLNENSQPKIPGFISCYASDCNEVETYVKQFHLTARCIPLKTKDLQSKCIFTGREDGKITIFAQSY